MRKTNTFNGMRSDSCRLQICQGKDNIFFLRSQGNPQDRQRRDGLRDIDPHMRERAAVRDDHRLLLRVPHPFQRLRDDMRRGAVKKLGLLHVGVTKVKVEVLQWGNK